MDVNEASRVTRTLLGELLGGNGHEVGVRLWDGSCLPDDRPRRAMLIMKHPGALRAMLIPGDELSMAEAYLYDDIDIEGEVEAVFDLATALQQATAGRLAKLRLARDLLRLPVPPKRPEGTRGPARLGGSRHSAVRDRKAVTYHYDVSNDFYQLWLDERMVYSCAYFGSPEMDLNSAQVRKLDYICRKLRLRPGQRLLDIGCGWGGLVMHAAKRFGVDATGITLSKAQAELATARIAEAGLSACCRVQVRDYREVEEQAGYDALVSVGMFEHVGLALLPAYFDRAFRLLRAGGVMLNHGIACRASDPPPSRRNFSEAYVFPDGELVPISTTLRAAEEARFEVRDVESLREHYALTLRHWVHRLEAHHEEALRFVSEPTYRVWRLYMSGSAEGFASGRLNVYQALLVKPDERGASGLPLTRGDWYH